jgi:hypothetical protein
MADKPDVDLEALLSTMARILTVRGDSRTVAILAQSTPSWGDGRYDNWDGGTWYWTLCLSISPEVWGLLHADERQAVSSSIAEVARDCINVPGHHISEIAIQPWQPQADDEWRQKSMAWVAGDGVTNQGRVRSNNIASREWDGLLFRSKAEINLYKALKATGLPFAPLPVFIRGGQEYRRMEPDFIIVRSGVVLHVEVDGDTIHQESPVEAHVRTTMLVHEGFHLERVKATDCETEQGARTVAEHLIAVLKKHAENK